MDIDELMRKRAQLESDMHEQIQDALTNMREDLSRSNDEVSRQLQETEEKKEQEFVAPVAQQQHQKSAVKESPKKPLIYFSYPMSGYSEQPAWVNPLRQVLIQNGYLTYNPWDKVNEQFGQQDLPALDALQLKIVKSLCSILYIPEEVLLQFDVVWKLLQQGDHGDNFGIVFQCLWFLTRASLVICDLMRPMAGAGTAQELLYSRQLGIPVIGLFPTSGQINPFAHRSTTALFSGTDLLAMLPMIKGYAPSL